MPMIDRRTALRLGAVLTGAGALGACSTGPAAPAAQTRRVDSAYGPVDVPARPTRIVTVSYNTPFQLQAVGVEPVGAFDYRALYDQLTTEQTTMLDRTTSIGTFGSPDLERVASLTPDLIVGEVEEVDAGVHAQLAKIAPTVIAAGVNRGDWKSVSTTVARAAGAEAGLTAARDAYAGEIARLRSTYAAALTGQTWVAFSFGDSTGQFSLQFPTGVVGGVLADLGVRFVPEIGTKQPGAGYQSYSVEQLSLLEPATVAVNPLAADGSPYPQITQITSGALFTRLPVAGTKRVYGLVQLYGTTDYRSANRSLAELESVVLTKL